MLPALETGSIYPAILSHSSYSFARATRILVTVRSREIEQAKWQEFAEAFSRKHDGWLVSISVESGRGKRRAIARDVPVRRVVAAVSLQTAEVRVLAGGLPPEIEHVIASPASMIVDETDDGAEAALTITDQSGLRTVIEFRSPMLTELVDGSVV
jgi:hypothetical protein